MLPSIARPATLLGSAGYGGQAVGEDNAPGEEPCRPPTAMADQPVHVGGGKVEAGESFYRRPHQDVFRTQRIGALLEQETQEPIRQPDRREQVE